MRGNGATFHTAAIFLNAFLLFLVQPVIAKQVPKVRKLARPVEIRLLHTDDFNNLVQLLK